MSTQTPRRVFLIGPAGVGKSTCGRVLAELIDYEFIDLDDRFMARHGDVRTHVETHGYLDYARRNVEVFADIMRNSAADAVIALSSGFLLYNDVSPEFDKLLSRLREQGCCVLLLPTRDVRVATEIVVHRIARRRPVDEDKERRKFRERMVKYLQYGDIHVFRNEPPATIAMEIAERYRAHREQPHPRDAAGESTLTKLYRSVLPSELPRNRSEPIEPTGQPRPPVNVPTVVDNLWEWVRPENLPSRRTSTFASPSVESARAHGPDGGIVFQIELLGSFRVCQVRGFRDSRKHPECQQLPVFLYKHLGDEWMGHTLRDKSEAGGLWTPCLSRVEVEALFANVTTLRGAMEALRQRISNWDSVDLVALPTRHLADEGEVFFESSDGHRLRDL